MVVFELPKKIKPKKKDYKAIEYFVINILNKTSFQKEKVLKILFKHLLNRFVSIFCFPVIILSLLFTVFRPSEKKIYPEGMRELLKYIKSTYGNPVVYVTENGVGDCGTIVDETRVNYLKNYIDQVLQGNAIDFKFLFILL